MPPGKDHHTIEPPDGDGDVYGVSVPCETSVQSDLAAEYMRKAAQQRITTAPEPPKGPRWPMFSGVFTFPFYLHSLGHLMLISIGLIVTTLLFFAWKYYGSTFGLSRLFGLPVCASALLTFSYATACCQIIVEETFHGWDSIDEWPEPNWKEWVWSLARMVTLVLQAGLLGFAFDAIFLFRTHWPLLVGTLVALPVVLLGALADGETWIPTAMGRVLRSMLRIGWAWILFYIETSLLIAAWIAVAVVGWGQSQLAVPFYAGPMLAVVMLIYARLLGRLAKLIRDSEDALEE